MLHFILLILKIIGWIFLAILLLLVLSVFIALFVPVRYELDGKCNGKLETLDVHFCFSFLLHFISGRVDYTEQKPSWKLRIGWKRLGSEEETVSEKEVESEEEPVSIKTVKTEEEPALIKTVRTEAQPSPIKTVKAEEPQVSEKPKKKEESVVSKKVEKRKETDTKGSDFVDKIKYKFTKICDKIKELIQKKDRITDFLTDEIHQSAFLKALSEIKRLFVRLKPKKINGEVEFGFDNPAWTGQVLAGVSMIYPFFAECVEIYPNFEEQVLKGQLNMKGSLSSKIFVSFGMRLLLDKNIRMTIRHIKNFKMNG